MPLSNAVVASTLRYARQQVSPSFWQAIDQAAQLYEDMDVPAPPIEPQPDAPVDEVKPEDA